MHLYEKRLSGETVYKGRIFDITHDIVELENGSTADRDVLHHHGGVCVIPITEDNEIYLVRQFRYPFGEVTREVPAGKLEKGEDHEECGRRELLEETGFTCGEFTHMGTLYPVPAYDTEIIHMYMARKLSAPAEQNLDEDEFLDVEKIPLSEAVQLVMDGEIKDSKTQIIILKAARLLGI